MSAMTNNPNEKVRQLQRRLWVCAKTSRTRRFHALYDRIYRSDVLWEGWKRVRSNKGAAGVDEITLRSIEEQGVTRFLEGIQADVKETPGWRAGDDSDLDSVLRFGGISSTGDVRK